MFVFAGMPNIAKFITSALERFDLFKEHQKAKILALWISFVLSLAGKQKSRVYGKDTSNRANHQ